MASIPGEVADALVTALEAPAVQAALTSAIAAGEVPLEAAVDAAINGAKAGGALGLVLSAVKGSIVSEVNAAFAQIPPATIAAYLTKLAQEEAKALGG